MLKAFRNASHGLFIKILFGAIILSFCLWGVGDIIRHYSASKAVITVGDFSTTPEAFSREYNKTKQQIRNIGEKALTDQEMKNIDFKKIVLTKLTNDAVLEQTYSKYGIIVSKKTILQVIESMPEFQRDGIFDGKVYSAILHRSGVSEMEFAQDLRKNLSRSQLLHPLLSGIRIPEFVKRVIAQDFEARKTLMLGYIRLDDIKLTDSISEDDVVEYYNSNRDNYKKPEARDISVLVIDFSKLANTVEITQSEIDEYYKQNKEMFDQKELRSFDRLAFQSAEYADKAWAMIKKDKASVKEVSVKLTPVVEGIDDMEKHRFPKEVGDELFGLQKAGDVSKVYRIGNRYYLYVLKNISKHEDKPKSEIDKEIKSIIQNEKTNTPEFYERVREMRHKIDDGIGSGKRIHDIASETGMRVVTIRGVTKGTENEEIKKLATDRATIDNLSEAIFKTEEEANSPDISSEVDTLSFVVHVDKVTKEYFPELKTIFKIVKSDLIKSKKDEIAKKKAYEITEKKGESINELSKLSGVKTYEISKKEILMHQQQKSRNVEEVLKHISNINVVMDIISTSQKGDSKYFLLPNGDYLVVGIKEVKKIESSDEQFIGIIGKHVDDMARKDFTEASVEAFKRDLKVEVDDKTIDKITKFSDSEEEKG